jgi:ABC-type nitrate/sulfonate/bicarbonate transport system substrate-binding protein
MELALDWTPNTNHTGIYVARARGYYDDAGVDVTVRSPGADGYEQTPAKRVATGESTVAIAPSESAISYHTHPEYESLTAVAAVCQRDASAIVALGESAIERPADLDGRTYASYDARFEDHIVAQLVRNDGGEGDLNIVTPPKLGIWNTLVEGEADATWVFMPWEGLLAERDGLELTAFSLEEYDVPYGYTPLLLARDSAVDGDGERLEAFLDATARGYEFAADNPREAADTLHETAEGLDVDRAFLRESQRRIGPRYTDGEWGRMRHDRWRRFVEWLAEEEILTDVDGEVIPADELDVDSLYTNELLSTTDR